MKNKSTTMRRYEGTKDGNLFILNGLDKALRKKMSQEAQNQPTIWKYMSLKHARSMIEQNQLHLVKPSTWTDPYEKLFLSCSYKTPEGKKKFQELFKVPSEPFCTCFTSGFQNDAQWKMYNDKNDVTVLIGFNAFDLFKSLSYCLQPCYIGGVVYISGSWSEVRKLSENEKNKLCRHDKKTLLGLLLRKRINYEYEKEIRLMHLLPVPRNEDGIIDDYFELKVPNLSQTIKEIKVDSKASEEDFEKIKQEFSAKGIIVRRSGLNREVRKWKEIDLTK